MSLRLNRILSVFLSLIFISGLLFSVNTGAAELPSKYVTEASTPVLNQKNNPLCWAYSGSDMLSISAIKNGYAEINKTVFSAPMLARAEFDGTDHRHDHGYKWFKCYGGIDYALMGAISGKGLLYNTEYPTVDSADKAPVSALYSGDAYVSDVRFVDISELSKKDRVKTIKTLIKEYGAVNADAFIGDYDKVTHIAKIQPFDNSKSSHAMLLVGWDDTKYTDTGTGAFLMKNTWGENWGDKGYAWISYNSELGRTVYAASVEIDADTRVFSYTETTSLSGNSIDASECKYGAVNMFVIDEKMTVDRVGIYTERTSSVLNAYVYKNILDVSKISNASPEATASGFAEQKGYYTLKLDKALNVRPGDSVTVLYLVKADGSYHTYSEYSDPDFELAVTSSIPGQSYSYKNGELKDAKGNYIGTLIGKTEHKEQPSPVTTEETTAEITTTPETTTIQTEVETTSAEISETDMTETDMTETENAETEYVGTEETVTSLPDDTEEIIPADLTDTYETRRPEETKEEDIEIDVSAVKSVFKVILIVIGAVVLLFILLILALIAASKKKKV